MLICCFSHTVSSEGAEGLIAKIMWSYVKISLHHLREIKFLIINKFITAPAPKNVTYTVITLTADAQTPSNLSELGYAAPCSDNPWNSVMYARYSLWECPSSDNAQIPTQIFFFHVKFPNPNLSSCTVCEDLQSVCYIHRLHSAKEINSLLFIITDINNGRTKL